MRFARSLPAAALIAASAACSHGETEEAAPAPIAVKIVRVTRGDVASSLTFRGVFSPAPGQDVRLGALASGRLAELDVAEGDRVS